jgi:hypothetical protein
LVTGLTGGQVLSTVILNAPNGVAPGNMGIMITSAANLGLTTIRRGHVQPTSTGGYGINRTYEVIPANNTALNATIRFSYADVELAGINESELMLWSSPTGAQPWTLLGADSRDITIDFVEKTGVNVMSTFALASSVTNTLPVNLLFFEGKLVNDEVQLQWSTAQEFNSDHFDIERSEDGRQFSTIAKLPAKGNSNTTSQYNYTDAASFNSVMYYRLKQVDLDGKTNFSGIVAISKKSVNSLVSVYPNPGVGPYHIRFMSEAVTNANLQVMDKKGNLVLNRSMQTKKGLNEWKVDLGWLPAGNYYLRLNGIDTKVWKIIKR